MIQTYKSHCPQYLGLEVFGDKWSLLIVRDIAIGKKKYFREFLQSEEKIASNILTNRLNTLESEGILTKRKDPSHKQKIIYSLTEKGIDLFPIMMEIARWSLKYKPVEGADRDKAQTILDGGPEMIAKILEDLKQENK